MAIVNIQILLVLMFMVVLVIGQREGGEREREGRNRNRDREERRRGRNRNIDQPEPDETLTTTIVPKVAQLQPPRPEMPCGERSSCSADTTIHKSFLDSNCFCDELCAVYDDCCEDFMRTSVKPSVKITKKMATCTRNLAIDPSVEIYIVDSCPKDYEDNYVKLICETESYAASAQFLNFPVSGEVSKVLYKNYFCAVCAGEVLEEINFWHMKVACGGKPQGVNETNKIELIEATLQDSNSASCVLEYFHPTINARKCKSNMDHCPANWKGNKKVTKRCKRGPVSYVYAGLNVFKNRFCAQCYNVNDTYLTCIDKRTPPSGEDMFPTEEEEEPSGPITPPFAIMLDINTGSATIYESSTQEAEEKIERVEIRNCPEDHVYDPFMLNCRRLRCPEGVVFEAGVCLTEDGFQTPPLPPLDPNGEAVNPPQISPDESFEVPERINVDPPTDSSEMPDYTDESDEEIEERIAHFDDMMSVTPKPEPEPEPDNTNQDGARPEYFGLECPTIPLNGSQFFILANNSAYVYRINKAIPEDMYISTGEKGILVCVPENWNSSTAKDAALFTKLIMFQFDRYQNLAHFVGLLISLTALLIHFIVFMMLSPLRDVGGKCIISLVVSLWFAQALFLAGNHLVNLPIPCLVVSAAMHYFFLVAFFWMNVLAIDICHTFNSSNIGSPSHSSGSGGGCRFACYSLYAWILPAIIVGGSVTMDLLVTEFPVIDPYRPYYAEQGLCWLTQRMGLLYLFAGPVAALILLNFILFIATSCQICRLSRASKLCDQECKERNRLFIYIKLTFIMGLTWTFAFLAAWLELWSLWYVFIIFNSLQGVCICFGFVCTRKVLKLLKESGRVHRSTDGGYYGNSSSRTTALHSGYARQTYLYDGGEAKVISQETSI